MFGGPFRLAPVNAPYRKTLFDRLGPDAGAIVKVALLSGPTFLLALVLSFGLLARRYGIVVSFLAAVAGTVAVAALLVKLSEAAGWGFQSFIQPSGGSTPFARQFSREQALAARGDVKGALAAYEQVIAAEPNAVDARLRAAELYAKEGADPARAAEHFRAIQRVPGVAAQHDLYASNRLVDLYRGPLGDEGRALVELRRLAERHPASPEAKYAREAIAKMKAKRDE